MEDTYSWWMVWALWIVVEVVVVMSVAEVLKRMYLKADDARWAKYSWVMSAPSVLLGGLGLLYGPVYVSADLLSTWSLALMLGVGVGALSPLLYVAVADAIAPAVKALLARFTGRK